MRHLFAVHLLVFAVVAACCHRLAVEGNHKSRFVNGGLVVLHRHVNRDVPWRAFLVHAFHHHFASNFHHTVRHTVACQHLCNLVACKSLGNAAEVELDALVAFHHSLIFEMHFCDAHKREQAVDFGLRGQFSVFIAESPSVHQRHHGRVVSTSRLLVDVHRAAEHTHKCTVGTVGGVGVEARHQRLLVKHIRAAVDCIEHCANRVRQVGSSLVSDVVFRGPHIALRLEKCFFLRLHHKKRHHSANGENQNGDILLRENSFILHIRSVLCSQS